MGFSTPKPKFDLAEFLSQKGTPRSSRKPAWKRAAPRPQEEVTADGPDAEMPSEGDAPAD